MTTTKTNRAQQIADSIEIVAKYFNADSNRVLTSFAPKNPNVARARIIIWHHLHACGLSFWTIGRIFGGLSADNVQRRTKQGVLRMTEEVHLMLATLPPISNSLKISKAPCAPYE